MDRYVPQDGLVRDLTGDLADTRDFLAANLARRADVLFGDGNIKISGADSFQIGYDVSSGKITCSNIQLIRFDDGDICSSTDNLKATISSGEVYAVCLDKDIKDDIPGRYQLGKPYPTPSEGINTVSEVKVTMVLRELSSVSFAPSGIVLYHVHLEGTNLVIDEDFRGKLGFTLPVRGGHMVPGPISEMSLATVFSEDMFMSSGGDELLLEITQNFDRSSSTNRETMLKIEWMPSTGAWMYEIQIIPYIAGIANPDYAMRETKIDDGLSIQRSWIPYVNAQKVDVMITPISYSFFRDRGDPITNIGFVVGSDRAPDEAPSLNLSTTIMDTMPPTALFNISSSNISDIVIMEIRLIGSSQTQIIYRGNAVDVTLPIPAGTWATQAVGTLLDGSKVSSEVQDPITSAGNYNGTISCETIQTVPIAINAADGDPRAVGFFYGPSSGSSLQKVIFCSVGSSISTNKPGDTVVTFSRQEEGGEIGNGTSILEIENGDWGVSSQLTKPYPYNLEYSDELNHSIAPDTLYRIDVEYNSDSTSSTSMSLAGTLILCMKPVLEIAI